MTGLVRPISSLGASRMQEHGRLRFGEKTKSAKGKEIPRALKTWRFTSPDREAIASIAEIYGGQVTEWNDAKANPQHQWQVTTTAKTIRVFLPPESLSIWYELWTGAGCARRCDGVTADVLTSNPREPRQEVPCLCQQNEKMECKPKTRMAVILPEIRFGGVWRMETGSWNAAEELPAMEAMLATLQTYGVLEARLSLVEQSIEGGSKQFVMPRLEFGISTQAMLEGMSTVVSIGSGAPDRGPGAALPALGAGSAAVGHDWVEAQEGTTEETSPNVTEMHPPATGSDEEVVDAEIVEESREDPGGTVPTTDDGEREATVTTLPEGAARRKLHARFRELAPAFLLDPDAARHAAVRTMTMGVHESSNDLTDDDVARLLDYLDEVSAGKRTMELGEDNQLKMPKVTG